MADIIIIAIIATAAFFILRSQLRKFRRGQCSCGCGGCSGNGCNYMNRPTEKAKN